MKTYGKVLMSLVFLAGLLLFSACVQSAQKNTPTVEVSPTATIDVASLVQNTSELREERLYLVELKMVREDFLNPIKNWTENEWKAEYQTVMVGQSVYEAYTVGQELSSNIDWVGTLLDDDFLASYKVIVHSKTVDIRYYRMDTQGNETEIQASVYAQLQTTLATSGNVLTVPFSGQTISYVLDKPFRDYQFIKREPLTRYFITLEIGNESWTLDLVKHARNWSTKHQIELEVPKELYDTPGEAWDSHFNTASFILRGRLSQLKGTIIARRTEVDPNFLVATTIEGKTMIIPSPR